MVMINTNKKKKQTNPSAYSQVIELSTLTWPGKTTVCEQRGKKT